MALLICGHPRSGTTLLRNLCLHHPQLAVTNEFGAFHCLGSTRREYSRYMLRRWWKKGLGGHKTLLTTRVNSPRSLVLGIMRRHIFTMRYLLRLWLARRRTIDAALVDNLYRSLFPDALHSGDKFPDYIFSLDQYAALDDLSIIVVYRDCRDVTSSALERARKEWKYHNPAGFRKMRTAEQIAKQWVRAISLMEKHRDRVHIIRYEDLVHMPRETLSALGDFLGVSGEDFPFDLVRSDRIGKHRSGLSAEELEVVLRVAGPTMRQIGYT